MTEKGAEILAKLGPKGQIVLKKEVRRALGLKPGALLRERVIERKIVLEPFNRDEELKRIKEIAKLVSKKLHRGLTSVDVIRSERR